MTSKTETSSNLSSTEQSKDRLETFSAPIVPVTRHVKLKPQISAPSYFRSLAENNLPPFQKPDREPRPILLVGGTEPLVSEDDVVHIIAASDADPVNGMKNYLARYIVNIGIIRCYDISERDFLVKFLIETVDYAAQKDFSACKLACLFTVYLTTHEYFKWYYWSPPEAIWNYFKELMIRHTVESSPDGQEVFEPDECYDIITHFHNTYITNLPLIHIATFGTHRVKLSWPFNLKAK